MIYKFSFILFCVMIFASCSESNHTDIATVTGKFSGLNPITHTDNSANIILTVRDVILGEDIEYETQLGEDGTFAFSIPVICESFCRINSEFYKGIINLAPNKESKFEVIFDEKGNKKVSFIKGFGFTEDELNYMDIVNMRVYEAYQRDIDNKQVLSPEIKPEVYSEHIINKLNSALSIIDNDENLSESSKKYLYSIMKIYYLSNGLLDYENAMRRRNHALHINEKKYNENDFIPAMPLKSYYSFLKDFNLNDIQYVASELYYVDVLQSILTKESLGIPSIEDTTIKDWVKESKDAIGDLVGFDSGLFYDLLAAQAYVKQLNRDKIPLSEKQKENIKEYFKNKRFTDILFAENENRIAIIEDDIFLAKNETLIENIVLPLKINSTPAVSQKELMNAIVSNYKGKVVVIDFWATWCKPCLAAMKKTKFLKSEMKNKDVVFVFITDASSPMEEWKEKIKEIGGEHYYLTEEERDYIGENMRIYAIPTYLYYDTNGKLKYKISAFNNSKEMRKKIEELLP